MTTTTDEERGLHIRPHILRIPYSRLRHQHAAGSIQIVTRTPLYYVRFGFALTLPSSPDTAFASGTVVKPVPAPDSLRAAGSGGWASTAAAPAGVHKQRQETHHSASHYHQTSTDHLPVILARDKARSRSQHTRLLKLRTGTVVVRVRPDSFAWPGHCRRPCAST